MRLISDRHLNLHSKSTEGGLVHLPRRVAKNVPDDVKEDPSFTLLRKSAAISVLKDKEEVIDEEVVEKELDELEKEGLVDENKEEESDSEKEE